MATGGNINLPNGIAPFFGIHSIFTGITVRPNADVKLLAVSTCNQTFRPMMIDRAGGQPDELSRSYLDLGVARLVRDFNYGVGVRNKEGIADEHHANRGVEPPHEYMTLNVLTVPVHIPQ